MSVEPDWRWADPSGQQRLVRTDELRAALASGVIAPNTPVWRDGWKEWRPAQEVPELITSALSAANGVVPNIPPPPLAVVAVQKAYEGERASEAGQKRSEPPPPPSYVPMATRPQPGVFHTPSHAMRPHPVPNAPPSAPRLSPTAGRADKGPNKGDPVSVRENPPSADGSAGLAALESQVASRASREAPRNSKLPTLNPSGEELHDRKTVPSERQKILTPSPSAVAPPMGISSLVGSAPPPPAARMAAPPPSGCLPLKPAPSKPPPPKSMSKPPPPVVDAEPDIIEELSGSVLLTEASGQQNAISELSGSMLMPDLSGAAPALAPSPATVAAATPPAMRDEELSGSFLLDAGSTGALPSVESTGQILAAKAAARAPFAAEVTADQTATVPKVIVPGDVSPDLASTVVRQPVPAGLTPLPADVAPLPLPPVAEPFMVPSPGVSPEYMAPATVVGVPPPPELAALQQQASSEPVVPPSLQSSRFNAVSDPLPPLERSTARLHDFRSLLPSSRSKVLVPALAVLGGVVLLGIIGLVVGMVRTKPSDEPPPDPAASASAAAIKAAPSAAPAVAVAPAATLLGPACTLGGVAHVIAPRAVVQSGVETDIVSGHLAVGFATHDRDGIAVALDPTTLSATKTARAHVHGTDPIRRLVPVVGTGGLGAAADVEHTGDFLTGRRTIASSTPFDLGFGGGGFAWTPHRSNEVDMLWTLDGDAPVEATRAAPLDPAHDDAGWAIAFRRGTSIYAGVVNGGASLTARGPLVKIDGLGPQVGSPTIAAQDGAVLVAWADRAQPSAPWALRWVRFAPGDASAEAKSFIPSEGGLGEHAMSPAIAAAGQGRFVLVWTEGPVSNHQVRAQTISGTGAPIGTAMAITDSGVNAGQAQVAILADGRGIVASLASSGTGPKAAYEVLATPIVCP